MVYDRHPELFSRFDTVIGPQHHSYINYSFKDMLGTLYYKETAGFSSKQGMTRAFTDEKATKHLYQFIKRLPICIVADGFYVSKKVITTGKSIGWDDFIRFKEGSAPLIEEKYQTTPENAGYINDVLNIRGF